MECTSPIDIRLKLKPEIKNGNTSPLATVRCGQCLNCRIQKRDSWAGRVLLENQTAMCGQFWTLTLGNEALDGHDWTSQKVVTKLARNFLQALRMSERRKANPHPIRFFGTLEYGDVTMRPHLHLAVFNALNHVLSPVSWTEGLERPQYHIGPWPHGHVDCQDLTSSTARYIAKYICKFNETEHTADLPSWRTYPRNPPLGYNGLRLQMEMIARSPRKHWTQPDLIRVAGKHWPMTAHMKVYYRELLVSLGLKADESFDKMPGSYIKNHGIEKAMRQEADKISAPRRRQRNMTNEINYHYGKIRHDRKMMALAERAKKRLENGQKTT